MMQHFRFKQWLLSSGRRSLPFSGIVNKINNPFFPWSLNVSYSRKGMLPVASASVSKNAGPARDVDDQVYFKAEHGLPL